MSDLMQAMADAGAPFEAILIAVRALEAKDALISERDAIAAERKAKDAERKRNVRGQSKDIPETVQGRSADEAENLPLSRPPNEKISNPPTHTPEHETTRARKGHRLPDDWTPTALTGDAATVVNGWPPGAVERELARFRDWAASATGANARKSNWDAAWRNWLRRVHDDGTYSKPATGRGSQSTTLDAMQRALELTDGEDGCGPASARSGNWGTGQVSDPMRAIRHVQ